MQVHVLNGDALAEKFSIPGKIIIWRECLIEGPVSAESFNDFFEQRATYLSAYNNKQSYRSHVEAEFQKLLSLDPSDEINLWFEHDLFCQANMWFILHSIVANKLSNQIFRISPIEATDRLWDGFGSNEPTHLDKAFASRVQFSNEEITLGDELWKAYSQRNSEALMQLRSKESLAFPYLKEVCEAEVQRFPEIGLGRPALKLLEIRRSGVKDFDKVFFEFKRTEGIYGFGDLQVQNLLTTLTDL
jgi:hypothetical protein